MKKRSFNVAAVLVLAIVVIGVLVYPDPDTETQEQPEVILHLSLQNDCKNLAMNCKSSIPPKPILLPDCIDWYYNTLQKHLDHMTLPVVKMELTSLGNYYITGYSPYECGGSWTTASGATCHRSSYEDRLTEPTTCAIDKSLHDFGDLFYIPYFDWVFVAEDTGSAVKGKHLDLFYPEYSDVVNFPTGYYEVFSVEYVYTTVQASDYDFRNYLKVGEAYDT